MNGEAILYNSEIFNVEIHEMKETGISRRVFFMRDLINKIYLTENKVNIALKKGLSFSNQNISGKDGRMLFI